ncbi:uncharacterized protein TRAVEDRAFT_155065 [Trametes versicolor FP-101664 SS1]|uniref:uncharacterized protein n=1 Tax=Trametes versicolor (strain FP-101664) TaxID=717944 RepID=UPI00046231CD|nr:uncharacterized protein TRAVEDRAFT_155065 [Trametes versicolor FP-101664 SS1]EIW53529.1 hypothetical protein TRAVEDRAFT_155065 [Trametes versicolor FP-101664 SS1]
MPPPSCPSSRQLPIPSPPQQYWTCCSLGRRQSFLSPSSSRTSSTYATTSRASLSPTMTLFSRSPCNAGARRPGIGSGEGKQCLARRPYLGFTRPRYRFARSLRIAWRRYRMDEPPFWLGECNERPLRLTAVSPPAGFYAA